MVDNLSRTGRVYSFLWKKNKKLRLPDQYHFDKVQEVVDAPIVKGSYGIEVGSGSGYDTYIMAKSNPLVKIVSLDISDGVYVGKKLASDLKNVFFIKGSALNIPIKDGVFDFAYSFGVLHHTVDPERGIREIARVLKKDCLSYVYLYEDHSENALKYLSLKIVNIFRRITIKFPLRVLYFISFLVSPLVFIIFSVPAMILRRFKYTMVLSEKIPFNFGVHPFSLSADLYDRFSAPVEHRFNRDGIFRLFSSNGFSKIRVSKIKATAGWVIWAHKK